jgi:hypothetical protein
MSKKLRHVIFLGAGASATSGYPIGQELRLRMASKERFERELDKMISPTLSDPAGRIARAKCLNRFDRFSESIELFRHGGFATVDEFSKLASEDHQEHAQAMKSLMRLALSLHNPEDQFHESDYYAFIQNLFQDEQLSELRPDVAVLSFNYDCYLDFLLLDAFRHRQMLLANPQKLDDWWCNKLTSGFFNSDAEGDWTKQTQSFSYFKLHGSIAYGNDPHFGHDASFRLNNVKRLGHLGDDSLQRYPPPVVFPWELFDGNSGKLISEDEFVFVKGNKDVAAQQRGRRLLGQLRSIWENAKRVVSRAEKISFVGLSLHPYMEDGLAHLFEGKTIGVEAVVANPENDRFRDARNRLHPGSPSGRLAAMFSKVAPDMKCVRSSCEDDGILTNDDPDSAPSPDITPRYSFKDFIEREMG